MNEVNLTVASKEWAKRSADERFWDLDEMATAMEARKAASREVSSPMATVKVIETESENLAVDFGGKAAILSELAANQLARRVGFLPSALPLVSTGLAAQILNERIAATVAEAKAADKDCDIQALVQIPENGTARVRAVTSDKYARVWDTTVVDIAKNLAAMGFVVPPARPSGVANERTRTATESDVLSIAAGGGTGVKVGDTIAPAGLYSGDRSSFLLLVKPSDGADGGDGSEFHRAVMIRNSEVGMSSLTITTALIRAVCGNHILWGCSEVATFSRKHIGDISQAVAGMKEKLGIIAASPLAPELEVISRLRSLTIADNADDVLAKIYKMRVSPELTQGVLQRAYAMAEKHRDTDGDPFTAWGMINGLTRMSQESDFADERYDIDAAAGKLMAVLSK